MNDKKLDIVSGGLLTVRDAEEFTGIGKSKLYSLMADGSLAYCKVGSCRRIPRRALEQFLAGALVMRNEA